MESTKKIKIGQVDVSTLATVETTTRTVFSCKALGSTTSGAGATVWASLYKREIPAGTITDLDEVGFEGMVEALTNGSSKQIGVLINTVDDTSTAIEIGGSGSWIAGANRMTIRRELIQRGTNLRGISTTYSNPSDETPSLLQTSQNQFSDYALNPANSFWVYLAVKGNVSDTFRKCKLEMTITPHKA